MKYGARDYSGHLSRDDSRPAPLRALGLDGTRLRGTGAIFDALPHPVARVGEAEEIRDADPVLALQHHRRFAESHLLAAPVEGAAHLRCGRVAVHFDAELHAAPARAEGGEQLSDES